MLPLTRNSATGHEVLGPRPSGGVRLSRTAALLHPVSLWATPIARSVIMASGGSLESTGKGEGLAVPAVPRGTSGDAFSSLSFSNTVRFSCEMDRTIFSNKYPGGLFLTPAFQESCSDVVAVGSRDFGTQRILARGHSWESRCSHAKRLRGLTAAMSMR
jgi:hypothetical protein